MVKQLVKHEVEEQQRRMQQFVEDSYYNAMNNVEQFFFDQFVALGIYVPTDDSIEDWLENL
jgi:hypothetical protein